jgi:hypothetical protein
MASKALTAVPRGILFCASHKPIEMLDSSDGKDPHFAEPHPGRQEFLLGQIENNLAAKVMISHRCHMETEIVGYDEEAQKDIRASKLIIGGSIAQNVEDIVLEQEKTTAMTTYNSDDQSTGRRSRGRLEEVQRLGATTGNVT